jgi:V8-like Glu-specific endopeptidase
MRRAVMILAIAALAASASLAAAPARADSGLTALDTADQSKGWQAVGRLDLGTAGFCTATLIAPDKVLTAAHCLYDKHSGKRFPVSGMQFLADWRLGRAAAYRSVKRAITLPDYVYASRDKLARVRRDLALIELARPIRLPSIRPFPIGAELRPGEAVGVVSYAQGRAQAPSLQQSCQVLGRQTGFFVLSCDIDFGSSGAPVFAIRHGQVQIVSVISAKALANGRHVSLGVDIAGQVKALETRLDAIEKGSVVQAEGRDRPTVLRLGGSSGGAKFLRP